MAETENFRKDFPLLRQEMNGRPIVYLDNGATTQKPESMIRAMCGYYGGCNANPHRGAYALSVEATDIYETARERVRRFIGAKEAREIIFTKNATEALNLVAYSYGLSNIGPGDEIVLTIAEHHSNLVPWQRVAKAKGAALKYIYLEKDGNLSEKDIAEKITKKTKIVAVRKGKFFFTVSDKTVNGFIIVVISGIADERVNAVQQVTVLLHHLGEPLLGLLLHLIRLLPNLILGRQFEGHFAGAAPFAPVHPVVVPDFKIVVQAFP